MKLSPGQRIQWQDYRTGEWHNATVVRVDMFIGDMPSHKSHRYGFKEVEEYPFDGDRHARGTNERYRLALHVDFFADDPKYVWPWRTRVPDQIREKGKEDGD